MAMRMAGCLSFMGVCFLFASKIVACKRLLGERKPAVLLNFFGRLGAAGRDYQAGILSAENPQSTPPRPGAGRSGALSADATQIVDSATREVEAKKAAAQAGMMAPLLSAAPGRLSFFKVDSLLRGSSRDELAAILARESFDRVIIANAMPFQGRMTRKGRQVRFKEGAESATGEDMPRTLRRLGVGVHLAQPGERPEPGVTFFDAETEHDLDTIVRNALSVGGSMLWVGSGGWPEHWRGRFQGNRCRFPPSMRPSSD